MSLSILLRLCSTMTARTPPAFGAPRAQMKLRRSVRRPLSLSRQLTQTPSVSLCLSFASLQPGCGTLRKATFTAPRRIPFHLSENHLPSFEFRSCTTATEMTADTAAVAVLRKKEARKQQSRRLMEGCSEPAVSQHRRARRPFCAHSKSGRLSRWRPPFLSVACFGRRMLRAAGHARKLARDWAAREHKQTFFFGQKTKLTKELKPIALLILTMRLTTHISQNTHIKQAG